MLSMAADLGGGIRLADSHLHHLQTAVGVSRCSGPGARCIVAGLGSALRRFVRAVLRH